MNLNQKLCPGVHSRPHKGPSQLWSFKEHHTSSGGSEGLGYIWSDVKISDCLGVEALASSFHVVLSAPLKPSLENVDIKLYHLSDPVELKQANLKENLKSCEPLQHMAEWVCVPDERHLYS